MKQIHVPNPSKNTKKINIYDRVTPVGPSLPGTKKARAVLLKWFELLNIECFGKFNSSFIRIQIETYKENIDFLKKSGINFNEENFAVFHELHSYINQGYVFRISIDFNFLGDNGNFNDAELYMEFDFLTQNRAQIGLDGLSTDDKISDDDKEIFWDLFYDTETTEKITWDECFKKFETTVKIIQDKIFTL